MDDAHIDELRVTGKALSTGRDSATAWKSATRANQNWRLQQTKRELAQTQQRQRPKAQKGFQVSLLPTHRKSAQSILRIVHLRCLLKLQRIKAEKKVQIELPEGAGTASQGGLTPDTNLTIRDENPVT